MDVNLQGEGSQEKPGKAVKTTGKSLKAKNSKILKLKNGPKKFKKRNNKLRKGGGLIYIGRIPHGFYEDQLTAYFSQFGKVFSAVVPRSKKSGRSKGYGYVEFEDEEVAKIAAESMNNYLMFNRIIRCRYIPPEERRSSGHLRGNIMHTCPRVLNRIKNINEKRKSLFKLDSSAYQKKTQKKIAEFKRFFEERNIDFNFKIDTNDSKDASKSNDSEKDEMKESSNGEEEMEDEFGVLEVDASDGEIHFKIPPQVKKVIKKSNSSTIAPKDSGKLRKKLITKRPRKSNSKEPEQILKLKETTKRNRKKETLQGTLKPEKSGLSRKRNEAVLNQKKLRMKQVGSAKVLKKEKSNSQQKSPKISNGKLSRQSSGEKNNANKQ